MDFSARATTKGAARIWRRRSCTPPRSSSTLQSHRLFRIGLRPKEGRVAHVQHARLVDLPGSGHRIGIRQTDELALVVREVHVIATERTPHPFGHSNHCRAVNVPAQGNRSIHCDERILREARTTCIGCASPATGERRTSSESRTHFIVVDYTGALSCLADYSSSTAQCFARQVFPLLGARASPPAACWRSRPESAGSEASALLRDMRRLPARVLVVALVACGRL